MTAAPDERGRFEVDGYPFGNVYPSREAAHLPAVDPRTIALTCLRAYIAGLTFRRPGPVGAAPIPFRISKRQIHIEQPDHEQDLIMPCIVFGEEGGSDFDCPGLVSQINEGSADQFGRGSALQVQYEQLEFFPMEVWAASKPERRAIVAGLQESFVPSEQMYGLRLKMLAYYGETVCFTLWKVQRPDLDAVRGRRRAVFRVEMRFNVVKLVNVERMQEPTIVVEAGPQLPGDDEPR